MSLNRNGVSNEKLVSQKRLRGWRKHEWTIAKIVFTPVEYARPSRNSQKIMETCTGYLRSSQEEGGRIKVIKNWKNQINNSRKNKNYVVPYDLQTTSKCAKQRRRMPHARDSRLSLIIHGKSVFARPTFLEKQ